MYCLKGAPLYSAILYVHSMCTCTVCAHVLCVQKVLKLHYTLFWESIEYCIAILLAESIEYCIKCYFGKLLSIVLQYQKNVLSKTLEVR